MIPQEIYRTLEAIVGSENISQDPEIRQAYKNQDRAFINPETETLGTTPDIVILPATTEEVQRIVKVAGRYKMQFDYAYRSYGILGSTDIFTFTFGWE